MIALVVGVLPSLPGFLVTIKMLAPERSVPFLVHLYDYAWFVGFALAFVLYLVLRNSRRSLQSDSPAWQQLQSSPVQPLGRSTRLTA